MNIISNGSTWLGQPQDTAEHLLEVLKGETLDPVFEMRGNFVIQTHPEVHVWGNFLTVSHVFNILGSTEEMAPLVTAIRENQARKDYLVARERQKRRPG